MEQNTLITIAIFLFANHLIISTIRAYFKVRKYQDDSKTLNQWKPTLNRRKTVPKFTSAGLISFLTLVEMVVFVF